MLFCAIYLVCLATQSNSSGAVQWDDTNLCIRELIISSSESETYCKDITMVLVCRTRDRVACIVRCVYNLHQPFNIVGQILSFEFMHFPSRAYDLFCTHMGLHPCQFHWLTLPWLYINALCTVVYYKIVVKFGKCFEIRSQR